MSEEQRPSDDPEPTRLDSADLKGDDSERPTETARTAGVWRPGSSPIPDSIGQYRIVSKLGEGGMGVVYEAQQEHPKRKVAVKVVRGGQFVDEHRVRMFQREADTLARLKHANIAAIYESGHTDDGQHFFAMELVRGQTLDAYLKERPKSVTTQELKYRLGLFRKIADAVHYAHQRGVIHRDLKPSNIIVADELRTEGGHGTISGPRLPDIKILDFGLARITEGDVAATTMVTEVGVIKGTLPYMSPEQARGNTDEICVRTDVYALGVILYEMLTGHRPYEVLKKSLAEAVRVICEESPQALKTTWSGGRKFDPDVETIVGRALEKDVDRRYASAAALSEDVSRYLTSQPILARPPSTIYQFGKFTRRNKVLVGGVAAVFLALAIGAIVSTLQAVRATRAEAEARNEAAIAEQVSEFLVELFEVSDPSEARGNTITARELLDAGAEKIERLENEEVRAELMVTMGFVYDRLGLYSEAEPLLERALATHKRVLGEDHPSTLFSMNKLANLYAVQRREEEAEPLFLKTIEGFKRVLGGEHWRTLSAMNDLALSYFRDGRNDEAESLHLRVLTAQRRVLGDEHEHTINSMHNLASVYSNQGRYDEAQPLYLEAIRARKRVQGDDHYRTFLSMNNLANAYKALGRLEEAEALHLETLEGRKRIFEDDHPDVLQSMSSLGNLYREQGRHDEAETMHAQTLVARRRVLGEDHPQTLWSMESLANVYNAQGRYESAEPLYVEALAGRERVHGADHEIPLRLKRHLANLYRAQGRYAEARTIYNGVLEGERRTFGEAKAATLRSMRRLAEALGRKGDFGAAEALLREVVEVTRRVQGEEHEDTLKAMDVLAAALGFQGRIDEAELLLVAVLEIRRRVGGDDHSATAITLYNLACLKAMRGNHAKAMDWLGQSVDAGWRGADLMTQDSSLETLHGPEFDALVERARQNAATQQP